MANPKALAFKEKGNVAFKAGDFPSAIGHYTSAILADRNDVTFPLNRAAAYLKLGKFEDTERDCNTVLKLSSPKINVKALFRRGQARVGMGKLLEAQKDFSDVLLQEPSNSSAAEELKTVSSLIQKEKAKKSKSTVRSIPTPSTSNGAPVKRRRVPIRIVGDSADAQSGSTSTSKAVTASTNPLSEFTSVPSTATESSKRLHISTATTPAAHSKLAAVPNPSSTTSKMSANGAIDTLQAVSSRSLKSPPPLSSASSPKATTAPFPVPAPSPIPSPPPSISSSTTTTSTPPPSTAQPTKPDSFKDAKQARESKTSSTKVPRVGGGIFRASGANTIFATRGGEDTAGGSETKGAGAGAQSEGTDAKMGSGEAVSSDHNARNRTPVEEQTPGPDPVRTSALTTSVRPGPPPTLFEFSKKWYGIKDSWKRWEFMNTVSPAQLPALCKTSLEPSLLVSILDVFLTVLTSPPPSATANTDNIKTRVHEYMENFTRIPRFSTLVLFLSKPEKEVAREVWQELGVDRPVGVWKPVGST